MKNPSPTAPAWEAQNMKGIKIVLAPSLELAKDVRAQLSVEAEYGDTCVPGTLYTAAHHGARHLLPAPCVDPDIPHLEEGTILVSHIDLDTVGGIARAVRHPIASGRYGMFWRVAAFVDTAGPHKLGETRKWDTAPSWGVLAELYAYWAWAQANRGERKDPSVTHDVTEEVKTHLIILKRIFEEYDEGPLHQAGEKLRLDERELNESTFVDSVGKICFRIADSFVNHLYTTPSGEICKAVFAFNRKTGAATLSFSEKDDPRNAADIMKEMYGPEAGGHKGIAGSPRGKSVYKGESPKSNADTFERVLELCGH